MKNPRSLSFWKFLLGFVASFAAAAGAEETLFNGHDLNGWKGDPRLWSVEDGILIGQTDADERAVEGNSFLIWQGGEIDDFELSLTVRITGGNNSGVQYRARIADPDNFALHGYQMDLHPRQDYNAMLYEEGGRRILCLRGQAVTIAEDGERTVETLETGMPETNLSQWNEYRIVAIGDTVEHWLNGTLAAKIVDRETGKYRRTGLLGLQLHRGAPMKAEFKDIVLKRLDFPNPVKDVTTSYNVLPGFKLEQIYEVPESQGSWVALTVDDRGRIYASDQYGGIFRMTLPSIGDAKAVAKVEPLAVPIRGAQGLLWARDALYAVVSIGDGGVFKISDSDGDDNPDHVQKIKSLGDGGEHGAHGLVPSPDGKWIYIIAGNRTPVPEIDASLVPQVWDEDQLLPRRPDARGHNRNVLAPGGWVARFTPNGDRWELVSTGYRNAYDLAFDERGELFTWDSDMEWDMGTPWYRPTRIVHIASGSEFGWRNGTGKWPAYYEDNLPAILDIGPGSPTGILAGRGLKFPERYQRAIFILDWTYATMYAVHLTPVGASYTAETEEIVAGAGLPMTDAVAGPDGALYFAIGGRKINSAVFRLTYTGEESTGPVAKPVPVDPVAQELTHLRRDLEKLHETPDPAALEKIWRALDREDRFVRFAARTALEHLPVAEWKARLNERSNTSWQTILAAIALARTGTAADRSVALDALDRIDPASLDEHRHLNLLRAYGLIFARHGEPDDARKEALIKRFDSVYPATTDNLNRELCRMLTYLNSRDVLPKTLRLMASSAAAEAPQWAKLAARNDRYGSSVTAMIENMPSAQNLFYAYCLRTLAGPWTTGQRRQFFSWLAEADRKSGGSSYRGFIADLREETLKRATPEERTMIEGWELTPNRNLFENLPSIEGPGRAWTIEEAVATAETGLADRDLARGKRMFHAALCAACHRFQGEGGGTGPDLTTAGSRFAVVDLVEAIVRPDKEISDQYAFDLLTLKDGSAMTGKILDEQDGMLIVATNPFDFTRTRKVSRKSVASIEPSPVSPMPGGLINRLNDDELRDLLAYLLRRNDP